MIFPSKPVRPRSNVSALRNLASLGVIVARSSAQSTDGNLVVNPSVVRMVGTYFVENTVSTGTMCPATPQTQACAPEQPLTVAGLMAAPRFDLQRNYRNPTKPAEDIQFDGRGVANPPPGMQDVSKSLPSSRDAF